MGNDRQPLLLLHGALGAASQFDGLAGELAAHFDLHTLNLPGHGGEPIPQEPFSIPGFAGAVGSWLSARGLEGIDVFGYSMGGYVALHMARHAPGSVGRIFTLATKFAWDAQTSARETAMLDPVKIEAKVPAFAEQLRARHAPGDWKDVLAKTSEMMTNLGERNELTGDDLRQVGTEVMVGVGDRDQMVTIEETLAAYRALPAARLIVLPGTPHPLERVSPQRLGREIVGFFMS
ncbi:MAG: alpha/beta fold hydrolase [Bacteroidetes bacterium]|nr:alpha/beta fold hydrolase [Bacteroidota bacterium]